MGVENPQRQKHIAEMSADECDSAIRDLRQKAGGVIITSCDGFY